ncbi:43 kDa relaxation protein [Acetobacter pomorum DM001]|uniref:43 kDa relaxation protein n=4 Tax=Acetobacter pomorum TaxID=65959 RepID=F1YWH2_9PROT|nr:MobA/MobL family protein [Acetobacter pomorum]EGE46862.1 43 kDa relaxation protein [Acetobacter pomorum DM001]
MNAHFGIDFKTARVNGSRKNGNNLRDKAAYAAREGRFEKEPDETDLVAAGSQNLPSWAEDSDDFWKTAEAADFGRTATNIRLDMPRNLPRSKQIAALQTFIERELANRPVSWGFHSDDASDGGQNEHVHILASTRTLDGIERNREQFFKRYNTSNPERGGTKKTYFAGAHSAARKEQWREVRTEWAQILNEQLTAEGLPLVDPRSLTEQGIDRPAQRKRGYNQTKAAEKAAQEVIEAQKTAIRTQAAASAAISVRKRRRRIRKPKIADPQALEAIRKDSQHLGKDKFDHAKELQRQERNTIAQKKAENRLSRPRKQASGVNIKAAKASITPRQPRIKMAPEVRIQKLLQQALRTTDTIISMPAHVALNAQDNNPKMLKFMRHVYSTEPDWMTGAPPSPFRLDIPSLSRAISTSKTPVKQFARNTLQAFKIAGKIMGGITIQKQKTSENSQKKTAAQKAWSTSHKPKRTKDIDLSDL